jgi:hypothetical protein
LTIPRRRLKRADLRLHSSERIVRISAAATTDFSAQPDSTPNGRSGHVSPEDQLGRGGQQDQAEGQVRD